MGQRMKLVNLSAHKNREVAAVLRELLEHAENGELQGFAFVAKMGHRDHRAGLTGDYRRHPEEALSATFLLERHLMSGGAHGMQELSK
jgi:hypothetical protein